jgi:alkylation response protein AidB-like acyl-CoA dehydrogenase
VDTAQLTADAAATQGKVAAAVELARGLGPSMPLPGQGDTGGRWAALSAIGAGDLSTARVAEAHLDALAILDESGQRPDQPWVWGVFAAEGPGVRLEASQREGCWELSGTKLWCSAAGLLDRALVTAHTDNGRRLFAIDLRDESVAVEGTGWVSRGLADVTTTAIVLDRTRAQSVGDVGWYLTRPGFAWGGIGVAACWYGGVLALARRVYDGGRRREPDQLAGMHLGRVDLDVQACRLALEDSARRIDGGEAFGGRGAILGERVRGLVAGAVDRVLSTVGHALGPGPLATEEEHARRVADLQVYVRQHHAERDLARLGTLLLEQDERPW